MAPLRAALVIGLAAGFTAALARGLGLTGDSIAYGAVIAALIVRPDFSRWPLAIYPVLVVVVGICMALGVSLGLALEAVPQVFVFGLMAALMQLLALLLPAKLRMLSGVIAVAGVLPLSEDRVMNASGGLFSLTNPDHVWSQSIAAVTQRVLP